MQRWLSHLAKTKCWPRPNEHSLDETRCQQESYKLPQNKDRVAASSPGSNSRASLMCRH